MRRLRSYSSAPCRVDLFGCGSDNEGGNKGQGGRRNGQDGAGGGAGMNAAKVAAGDELHGAGPAGGEGSPSHGTIGTNPRARGWYYSQELTRPMSSFDQHRTRSLDQMSLIRNLSTAFAPALQRTIHSGPTASAVKDTVSVSLPPGGPDLPRPHTRKLRGLTPVWCGAGHLSRKRGGQEGS